MLERPAQNLMLFLMSTLIKGLQYLVAGLLGLVMAVAPTISASWIFLPADGPPGEGFVILFFYLVSCCACIPIYVALMSLHRRQRRATRKLIAYEVGLRLSMVVATCFLCFMAIKLPTRIATKTLFSIPPVLALAWAANPLSWERSREKTRLRD